MQKSNWHFGYIPHAFGIKGPDLLLREVAYTTAYYLLMKRQHKCTFGLNIFFLNDLNAPLHEF